MSGEADEVAAVKARIEDFLITERRNSFVLEVSVPSAAFPIVIGSKGATIRELQQNSGCRLDLDRNRLMAILKGR